MARLGKGVSRYYLSAFVAPGCFQTLFVSIRINIQRCQSIRPVEVLRKALGSHRHIALVIVSGVLFLDSKLHRMVFRPMLCLKRGCFTGSRKSPAEDLVSMRHSCGFG
ncbi:hypothetical protein VTK26DRAFT_2263 [Humicola hyalothermophila]